MQKYPDVKFVIFSVHEDFRYAQSALRLGALDYISKISFEGDECDRILELVERKYKENHSQKETRNEDSELIKRLEKAWMNTRWIFNDSEFSRLYELTRGVELRTAERVFIKSFLLWPDKKGACPAYKPTADPFVVSIAAKIRWQNAKAPCGLCAAPLRKRSGG